MYSINNCGGHIHFPDYSLSNIQVFSWPGPPLYSKHRSQSNWWLNQNMFLQRWGQDNSILNGCVKLHCESKVVALQTFSPSNSVSWDRVNFTDCAVHSHILYTCVPIFLSLLRYGGVPAFREVDRGCKAMLWSLASLLSSISLLR